MKFEKQLLAAEGYSELGLDEEALAQLDELSEQEQDLLQALRMRIDILLRKRDWQTSLRLSLRMCELHPKESGGYINAAYCLREMGRTLEAKQTLLDGPASLLNDATYYYNLACYESLLGNLNEAKAYLHASFRLKRSLRDLAKTDADLERIRDIL
jgi:predicted Zn-dependent protease